MADIELVIKIPEEEYDECIMQVKMIEQEGIYYGSSNYTLKKSIANGTPLPKGHGDLIDMNEITAFRELECNGHDVESLDEFTVIIEADGE